MPRPGIETKSERNNQKNFLDGCEKLHGFLCRFAEGRYPANIANRKNFAAIKNDVQTILAVEGTAGDRCRQWQASSLASDAPAYIPEIWENEKRKLFERLPTSTDGINTHSYRFHQAAAYHRYYVLKDLLPEHGIAVY